MGDDKSEEHAVWEASSKVCETNPGALGCVRRHGITKELLKTPCDYQWNSFDTCKTTRCAPYELNARKGMPYQKVLEGMTDPKSTIVAKRQSQGHTKSAAGDFFKFQYGEPTRILANDPLAWNINYTIPGDRLPYWTKNKWPGKTAENFLPSAHGGLGAMIPYNHNHHHLIPNGAFRDSVILGPGLGTGKTRPLTAFLRICVIRLSQYNLNEKPNLCILPQQVHISEIVGLPAHCPYGVVNHKGYSDMVQTELDRVRDEIDNAIGEAADHKALRKVKIALKGLEQRLWIRVKTLEPVGAAIGT